MKLLVGFVTICGSVAADSAQVTDSAVLLPVMRSVPSLFASDSTWFGSFTSHSHGFFADSETGIAKAHFFAKGPNADPFVRLTAAESAHLDSRTVDCEVNLRFAKLNESALTAEVRVESGTEYVVSASTRQTVLSVTEYDAPDFELKLHFKAGSHILRPSSDPFTSASSLSVTLRSNRLNVQVTMMLEPRSSDPNWHLNNRKILSLMFGLAMLIISFVVWVLMGIKPVHLGNTFHSARAQGSLSGLMYMFVFLHLVLLTYKLSIYQTDPMSKVCTWIWIAGLLLNACLSWIFWMDNFSQIGLRNHPSLFVEVCFCSMIAIIGIITLQQQTSILDSQDFDSMMVTFLGYPLYQIYFVAYHTRIPKEYYFWWSKQAGLNLWPLLWCAIMTYGSGITTFQLKPRPTILLQGSALSALGFIIIFLQSKLGKKFFFCIPDHPEHLDEVMPLLRGPARQEL